MLVEKPFQIYDNVFDINSQIKIFENILGLNYFLGWGDRVDRSNYRYLHSPLNINWLNHLNFFEELRNTELREIVNFKKTNVQKVVVNASFPGYFYSPHTHYDWHTLVYYANIEWEEHWAGETLIYNGAGKEANICIPYTPNRVLLINKDIPHALRPPTFAAPFYRFSVSIFFD